MTHPLNLIPLLGFMSVVIMAAKRLYQRIHLKNTGVISTSENSAKVLTLSRVHAPVS